MQCGRKKATQSLVDVFVHEGIRDCGRKWDMGQHVRPTRRVCFVKAAH